MTDSPAPATDVRAARPDLRMAGLGAAGWAGALAGHAAAVGTSVSPVVLAPGAVALAAATLAAIRHRAGRTWVLVALVLGVVTLLRVEATTSNVVSELADRHALVTVVGTVASDPVVRPGRFADVLVYRVTVTRVEAPVAAEPHVPVVLFADPDPDTARPRWGSTVRVRGRLSPADDPDTTALLSPIASPERVASASLPHRWADEVRGSIRRASSGPAPGEVLVPALVDGDDAALPPEVESDFRTAGLTHLTAVSGANLTILLAFLLPCARWSGIRSYGLVLVGGVGILGFVLVARPEPSVLRAAVMGTAALVGLAWGGRVAGARALGVAVLVLLLVAPGLSVTWGFALSVVATAGILFLAPAIRDALARHLPRWLAEAVAVPLAAQVACTPLVAVLSAEVSVVAVVANLVAAPLVGPTTVLGLAGGLLGLVAEPLGAFPGRLAALAAQGIVVDAQVAAAMPGAAVPWSPGGWPLLLLVAVSVAVALLAPRALGDPRAAALLTGVLVLALLRPPLPAWTDRLLPGGGWPPEGWVVVMCDVGQGDAVVLPAGPGRAVVVDAGPDPRAVDGCLRRLGVREVPVLVLTHFHDDHVAGLPGVMRGRHVGEILVSPLRSPEYGADQVADAALDAGVPVRVPTTGETLAVAGLRWQVLAPTTATPSPSAEPNDASLVLLADVGGTSVMLTGDVEPIAQAALGRAWSLAAVDVLKVAHHGSRYQDDALLRTLSPDVALVSSGQDNDYGHPAPRTIEALRAVGASVWRTDVSGDLAVVPVDGGLRVVTRH